MSDIYLAMLLDWIGKSLWIFGLFLLVGVVPFLAYHRVRVERDELYAKLKYLNADNISQNCEGGDTNSSTN